MPRRSVLAERIRSAGMTSWAVIGIALVVYGVFRFLVAPLGVIFAPLAIAIVVVYILNPIVSALERRGIRRGLGALIVYGVFLIAVSAALSRLVPIVGRQVTALFNELPAYVERLTTEGNALLARRGARFRIPEISSEQAFEYLQQNRQSFFEFFAGIRNVAANVLHVLVTLVIGIIVSIYALIDLPKIQRGFIKAVPPDYRDEVLSVLEKVGSALGAFFRGQLLVALFVGVMSALLLTWPVKLPFSILIGLIAGLFNLIPLVGPFLAAIPAVIVGSLSGEPIKALWALLALLVVQQVDNHVVSPNIMGRSVQLHPITVMLALLVGGTLAGILGMLVAIPGFAAAKIVAAHAWSKRAEIGVPDAIADAGS